MNVIFGFYYRNSRPVPQSTLERMQSAMSSWGVGDCTLWMGYEIGLGWTCEATSYEIPSATRLQTYAPDGTVFAAAGRVDNSSELCRLLRISEEEQRSLSDGEVMKRAYLKWGEGCSERIFGDWSFVAWHPSEHRLILSRDHYGNTPLYYFIDQNVFAFSSSRQALLVLNLAPVQLDELYLAQYLTSWMGYHGERTLHHPIRRLPPAHNMVVTQDSCSVYQYWRLEDTPELTLSGRGDYVEAFRPLFDEAVRCRLRSDGPVACALSGGLDSSSVAVTAASFLKGSGGRLTTFTSVPFSDTSSYVKSRFGDEFPFANATARFAGNIDVHPLASAGISPISAIRCFLQRQLDPCHAACNLFWIKDIQQSARTMGCRVLLTGAMGNGGISWDGDVFSQPWSFIWRQFGLRKLAHHTLHQRLKDTIKLALPIELVAAMQQRRMDQKGWLRTSAIHPDFARRVRLIERMLHDPAERMPQTPKVKRCRILLPGRSIFGVYAAEMGAAHGLEVRDPTADARVLAFTFSVPDRIYIDPQTGLDRWLIREAMKGRLPEEVRLNRNRGRQAGDLVARLRACAPEVETALNDLAHGLAAEYVDVAYMRQVWRMIQAEDTHESFAKSITILTRGIMAGLFVNQFYE